MKDITVPSNITIRQAMKQLSLTGEKCLVITNEENKLLGTLSDGDVRNAILKGVGFGDSIESIFQQNPTVLVEGKYSLPEVKKLFASHKFDLIPVVNEKGTLADILFWESVLINGDIRRKEELDVPVVIMAGGKGTRLEPFTKILPKPLVPIHEKPIIEHIIERFTDIGCQNFFLSLNYKGKILKAYFQELNPDYKIHFVEEQSPSGTAGSLSLLKGNFEQPFFVTNCDIIIKTDYNKLYEFHKKGGYSITLVASAKEFIIPYGTCKLNSEGHLLHITEKPKYDFLVNTGLYILNPDILELIPENKFYHITNLITDANNMDKKVGVFPINDDDWIDTGQWEEYQKAIEKLA